MISQTLACIAGPNPWTKIHDLVKPVGFAIGFIALGAVGQAIYDGSAKLPWLHGQAATLQAVETKEIPALKSVAGCEEYRAKVLAGEVADLNGVPNCLSVSKVPKVPAAK